MRQVPKGFLTISRRILKALEEGERALDMEGEGLRECWIRTGISRAYYAAFLVARRKVGLEGYERPDVHKKVIERLDPITGQKLADLRKGRNDADYVLNREFKIGELKWACQVAERLISEWEVGG